MEGTLGFYRRERKVTYPFGNLGFLAVDGRVIL
jgi:hypothetical protein